jgi:hypothetical protein
LTNEELADKMEAIESKLDALIQAVYQQMCASHGKPGTNGYNAREYREAQTRLAITQERE